MNSQPGMTLREAMDQLGHEAEGNGLTPEILESILRDGEDEATGPSATLQELLAEITAWRDRATGEAGEDSR